MKVSRKMVRPRTSGFPKRYVTPTWIRAWLFIGVLLTTASTLELLQTQGWSAVSAGLGVLAVFMVVGFAESLFDRVELHPDRLVVVSCFRKREYARGLFKRATWEKGCSVALEYAEGGWLELPAFVGGGPGVLSTFRSWLKGGKHAAQ